MKIAIRADGGANIGMGHVIRTIALAKEIAKSSDVFYICKVNNCISNEYSVGIDKIRAEGFHVITISEHNLINEIISIEADCLITDSYDVDENYFNKTAEYFKYTGYIDDLCLHDYNVNFIINQNINALDLDYNYNTTCKFFLGSKYIMLRDEFRNTKPKHISEKVEDIMITAGGADSLCFTQTILNCVKETDYNFHVAIGSSFEKEYIQKILSHESDNVHFYFNANMYELMNRCDLAISAAGSTLYELAACGTPTLGIVLADNQLGIAEKMHEMGIINYLGWYHRIDNKRLINKIDELSKNIEARREISLKAQKLIDGKGVEEIAKYINSLGN